MGVTKGFKLGLDIDIEHEESSFKWAVLGFAFYFYFRDFKLGFWRVIDADIDFFIVDLFSLREC